MQQKNADSLQNMTSFVLYVLKGNKIMPIHKRQKRRQLEDNCEKALTFFTSCRLRVNTKGSM